MRVHPTAGREVSGRWWAAAVRQRTEHRNDTGRPRKSVPEMRDSLNCALFQGPPHALRAYFEQQAARGSHISRPDPLPLSPGLASTGSPASRNKNWAVQAVLLLSVSKAAQFRLSPSPVIQQRAIDGRAGIDQFRDMDEYASCYDLSVGNHGSV